MDTYDVYEEYPELRNIRPRRSKKRRASMTSSGKLALLLAIIAAAALLALVLPGIFADAEVTVYSKNGEILQIKSDELEKYLAEGWYASPSDIVPTTLYAEDGSVLTAAAADVSALEKKGYSADLSAAFTVMYADDGGTLIVPKAKAAAYEAKGWHSSIRDVTKTLYKSDGSKITVMNAEAQGYIDKGWTASLFKAAKKMVSPEGEEQIVFNDDVNEYIGSGWTAVKRVIDPDAPMVALTFDDGPGKYTGKLLDCLEKNNSAATFYTLGYLVKAYPDVAKRASELGCEVSNHTWEHTDLTKVGTAEAQSAIQQAGDEVLRVTGKYTPTYRPCFGAYNDSVLAAIDLPAIMWSIDTLDWKTRNADLTYNKIMSDVYDGAIILMHDIHEPTVEAACRAIPELVEQGYQLVTVQELLEYKLGGMENGKVYFDAK